MKLDRGLRSEVSFAMVNALTAQTCHPPAGAADDWTVPQAWDSYTPAEHALWDRLFARQVDMLQDRAAPAFLRGLDVLKLSKPGVPDFRELSDHLMALTGWRVVA